MRLTPRLPRLNNYHKSDSLIFQFILSEFIASYREISAIHRFANEEITEDTYNFNFASSLKACLQKLSYSPPSHIRAFSSNVEGILAKLKNYCAHFSKDKNFKESQELHRYVHEAWLSCLQSIEILDSASPKNLDRTLGKIVGDMRRFARVTAKLMQKFRWDENVVFFMLNHHKQLDELYGQQFVFKQLSRMFAKGIDGAAQFLQNRYIARGFNKLLPTIKMKLTELETTTP